MRAIETLENYPTTEAMQERWASLGRAIALDARQERPAESSKRFGSLTILGSGIAHGDLSIGAESEILNADRVFYSINDFVSKTWMNQIRPDAYDLSILYNERVERHYTYVRMTESMLHFVRRGEKVVAVFYGHPGVFAAPGHRAIRIARREGHAAKMRPGVSALDCMIADLGFDPALPGMITYEASDMLLRNRRIDTTLHMVIWQVGIVGEFGFDRGGYANRGLEVLIDALEGAYGADWPVTHYIGSQYAGLPPRINTHPIGALREPRVAKRLGTLSTFYIRPKHAADTDAGRAIALGAVPASRDERETASSGSISRAADEQGALRGLADMPISPGYSVPTRGAIAGFLSRLSTDSPLRDAFERDPRSVLDGAAGDGLSDEEKATLALRDQRAVMMRLRRSGG